MCSLYCATCNKNMTPLIPYIFLPSIKTRASVSVAISSFQIKILDLLTMFTNNYVKTLFQISVQLSTELIRL